MTANLASLDFKVGRVNPSGISPIAYFIPKEDIASWPVKKDDIADAASLDKFANLDGDFVLVTGKKWLKVYCTQGKGKCTFEPFGETDSKMYNNKAELFFPDLDDNARAFATVAANGDFVFIIPTPGAVAKYHVIGDKYWRATVETNGDFGDAAGSAKGMTIAITCPNTHALPRYTGDLVLEDGTLDCSNDTFTPAN